MIVVRLSNCHGVSLLLAVVLAFATAMTETVTALTQQVEAADLVPLLARLPRSTHNSEIREDADAHVEGRIWGHPFRLLASQLELLRAYAFRVVGASGPAPRENSNGPIGRLSAAGSGRVSVCVWRRAYLMNSISR